MEWKKVGGKRGEGETKEHERKEEEPMRPAAAPDWR